MSYSEKKTHTFYSLRDKSTGRYYSHLASRFVFEKRSYSSIKYPIFQKNLRLYTLAEVKYELLEFARNKIAIDNIEVCRFTETTETKETNTNLKIDDMLEDAKHALVVEALKGNS